MTATSPTAQAADARERIPAEGGKRTGTAEDRDRLIAEINILMERHRLQQGLDSLKGDQLEKARSEAFYKWASQHHSDLRTGPEFEEIKNTELQSNVGGPLDLDWLATLASTGPLARGPVGAMTYLAGKELWFAKRAEKPDRTTFSTTYPDTNWRALNAADLLLSGKVSVEEVFIPERASKPVRDRVSQMAFQRSVNDAVAGFTSGNPKAKPDAPTVKGVTMAMRLGDASFRRAENRSLDAYLCVSLRALALAAADELGRFGRLSEETAWLGGLNHVTALMPDGDDWVLIGQVIAGHGSCIHLDDVATVLHSTVQRADPFVSLDPRPENVLRMNGLLEQAQANGSAGKDLPRFLQQLREAIGPQMVVVGGIPRGSRAAHTLIDADYALKSFHQGLTPAPGLVKSSLERSIENAREQGGVASGGSMSRVWYCLAPQDQPVFGTNSNGAIWLEQCHVVVRTERQVAAATGQLEDAHTRPDPEAEAFCEEFSRNVAQIGELCFSIRSLVELFRIKALLEAAFHLGAFRGDEVAYLAERYPQQMATPMPESLPGLANGKVVSWTNSVSPRTRQVLTLTPLVCGGVDMSVKIAPRMLVAANVREAQLCDGALRTRPNPTAVFWRMIL